MLHQIKADRLSVTAAGLAFYAMLAVFPALIALLSIYGFLADPAQVGEQVRSLSGIIPETAVGLIQEQLVGIAGSAPEVLGWTAAVAIAGALWSASGGTQQLLQAVNLAYGEEETRGFLRLRGLSLLLTLGLVVVGMVSLGLIVIVPPLLPGIGLSQGVERAIDVGRFVLLALALMAVLSAVYRYAPDRDQPRWPWLSWGAVAATIIWVGASILFSVYVANFGAFGETYGSLAGVIVLLVWFYISGFVILLGAEINAEMEHQTTADTTQGVGSRCGGDRPG